MLPFIAQEQAIIGLAGIVHAIVVDDAGFDKSAQFQQMVPVTAISREPRGIQAQNSADLARAQPCDQAIEAGAGHCSARGSPEIVVDDLNVGEAALTRNVDEVILPPLALQVGHDLGLR